MITIYFSFIKLFLAASRYDFYILFCYILALKNINIGDYS